jgi:hypothetical protein
LVEYLVWDQEAAGSSPVIPTVININIKPKTMKFFFFKLKVTTALASFGACTDSKNQIWQCHKWSELRIPMNVFLNNSRTQDLIESGLKFSKYECEKLINLICRGYLSSYVDVNLARLIDNSVGKNYYDFINVLSLSYSLPLALHIVGNKNLTINQLHSVFAIIPNISDIITLRKHVGVSYGDLRKELTRSDINNDQLKSILVTHYSWLTEDERLFIVKKLKSD